MRDLTISRKEYKSCIKIRRRAYTHIVINLSYKFVVYINLLRAISRDADLLAINSPRHHCSAERYQYTIINSDINWVLWHKSVFWHNIKINSFTRKRLFYLQIQKLFIEFFLVSLLHLHVLVGGKKKERLHEGFFKRMINSLDLSVECK